MAKLSRRQYLGRGGAIGAGLLAAACDVPSSGGEEETSVEAEPTAPADPRLRIAPDLKQPEGRSQAKQPVTLRVLFSPFSAGYTDFEIRGSQHHVAKLFTETHPRFTITWQRLELPWAQGYEAWLSFLGETAAAGQFYDVLHLWTGAPAESGTYEALLGLNRFIRRDRFDLTDFWPGATWQHDLFGLFTEVETNLLFYNRDLFTRAGAPVPTDKWTWDDLLQQARALTQGEGASASYGFTPIPSETSSNWAALPWIWGNGGDMLNEDQTRSVVDQPAAVEALQWLANLRHTHQVWPTADQVRQATATQQDNLFMMGRLAMLFGYRGGLDGEIVSGRQDRGVAVPPQGPVRRANMLFMWPAFYIGAATGIPDDAWTFLSWWTGVEAQRAWHHGRAIKGRKLTLAETHPPARRSLALELVDWFGELDVAALEHAQIRRPHAKWREVVSAFDKGLAPVWRGEEPVEVAVEKVAQEQDAILAG